MQLLQLGRGQGKSTRALSWLMAGDWLSGPERPRYGIGPNFERAQEASRRAGGWSRILVASCFAQVEDFKLHLYDRLGCPASDETWTAAQASPREKFLAMSVNIMAPYELLKHGQDRDRRIEVAVDELDDVLYALFGHNVALATITPEETR
jgi:hypothetical protein